MPSEKDLPNALRQYLEKSGVPLAVSVTERDAPLVFVNTAFCNLTGYSMDEVVGRNCRFLQGAETAEEERLALHEFVHDEGVESGRFPILNYRKDGKTFRNLVFMTRLRQTSDDTRFILASQFDMTHALERSQISTNDAELVRTLDGVEQMGREFGLAMMGSAKLISDSVATMAKMTLAGRT